MVIVSITPEIYLEGLKTYAGGLGVLEGDKFYAAGDLGLDYVVLTLFYRNGYIDIQFDSDKIIFKPQELSEKDMNLLQPGKQFKILMRGDEVFIQPWIYRYKTAKAVLFEAICPTWARKLTRQVYIEDDYEQTFLKYTLLAKASAHYMKNHIGFENIRLVDLQEAHTALILLTTDYTELKDKFRFIIHTPGPWGHPSYPGDFIAKEFGYFISDYVSLTHLALSRTNEVILVSEKQRDVLSRVFVEHRNKFKSVTNGVHLDRWVHEKILSNHIKGLVNANTLMDARRSAKEKLNSLLKNYKDVEIGDRPVVSWTRRLVRYKRPYFIYKFIEEYGGSDVVFVIGGKPHPNDFDGLNYAKMFRKLHLTMNNVIYIHDYDVEKARVITQASDILAFTPFSGWEACGTSYMKAMVNGVHVVASRDGGVLELIHDEFNGWLFGEDHRELINLYVDRKAEEIDAKEYQEFNNKLRSVIKIYYENPDKYWGISYNAYRTSIEKVDVKNALKKYYLM